jgi:hypothetical protein
MSCRRRQDRRTGELPGIDRIAQGQDEPRIAAEIAQCGEAGEQGLAGIEDGGERLIFIVAARGLEPRLQPVIEPRQMDVAVDQARQARVATGIVIYLVRMVFFDRGLSTRLVQTSRYAAGIDIDIDIDVVVFEAARTHDDGDSIAVVVLVLVLVVRR